MEIRLYITPRSLTRLDDALAILTADTPVDSVRAGAPSSNNNKPGRVTFGNIGILKRKVNR